MSYSRRPRGSPEFKTPSLHAILQTIFHLNVCYRDINRPHTCQKKTSGNKTFPDAYILTPNQR
jgi:hypothetical protein